MVNALYGKGREKFLEGNINWLTITAKAVLVDTTQYTANLDNDEFLSAIPSAAQVSTSPAFTNKTGSLGVADADDITFSSVSGSKCEALIIFEDTGTASTSPLLAYIDSATGLPVTPNNADIIVKWDDGANKIFKL